MLDKHTQYGYFPNAKQEVIYTSAPAQFKPLPFLHNNYKTFGFIGRIHPTKGVDQLIKVFLSSNKEETAHLYIAGEGPEEYVKLCKDVANFHPNIHFLGKIKANDFYPKVDAVIINSLWHEPFPRVLVEAYSFGRPVLASSTGGTSEMVVEAQTGYTYNPFQLQEFENKLAKILSLDRQEMINLHRNVKAFFTENLPDQTGNHISLYNRIIKKKHLSSTNT